MEVLGFKGLRIWGLEGLLGVVKPLSSRGSGFRV